MSCTTKREREHHYCIFIAVVKDLDDNNIYKIYGNGNGNNGFSNKTNLQQRISIADSE